MTSKQRALLRAHANTEDTILYLGKEGITDSVIKQAWDALEAREIIKVSVQRNAPFESTQAACDALCTRVHAEPVQCIGGKFSIYRRAREKPKLLEMLETRL